MEQAKSYNGILIWLKTDDGEFWDFKTEGLDIDENGQEIKDEREPLERLIIGNN